MADWTPSEIDTVVDEYFQYMASPTTSKADLYRRAQTRIPTRNIGGVRRKMENISAILRELGLPFIQGIKPSDHYQGALKVAVEKAARISTAPSSPGFTPHTGSNAPRGNPRPERRPSTGTTFVRDPDVVDWLLRNAKGVCEACSEPGPFLDLTTGLAFLEVHHVIRLADEGPDVVTNAIAACPNCHRALHHAPDRAARAARLYKTISRLRLP